MFTLFVRRGWRGSRGTGRRGGWGLVQIGSRDLPENSDPDDPRVQWYPGWTSVPSHRERRGRAAERGRDGGPGRLETSKWQVGGGGGS